MVILLRILLVILPLLALFWWLRSRARKKRGEELQDRDLLKARLTMAGLVVAIIAVGIGLKMSDDSAETDQVYVPARVVDGELIPGHFVPADQVPAVDPQKTTSDNNADPES